MDAANLIAGEKVAIVDNNNGERFETYIIKGERGSGCICLNGAAARKVAVGDLIIIISYALMDFEEAKTFTPSIIVDIVLAVICVCVIIKYSIKGFLKTVLDIARLGVSVLLAVMFRGVIADLLNNLFMTNSIRNWVYNSLTSKIQGISETVDFVRIYEDAPEFYSKVLAAFDLNFEQFEEAIKNLNPENVDNVTTMIAEPLANMFSTLIAVIAIFSVAMIVLYFIVKLISKITKIKLIGVLDRILGIGFGALLASILVWGISFLLQLAISTFGPMYPDIINSSLTENSMIINVLKEAGLLDIFEGIKNQITDTIVA
jgi:uncharacterized membrane protein required for colicin V production